MTDTISRRDFIGRTAALGAGVTALGHGAVSAQDALPRSTVVLAAGRPGATKYILTAAQMGLGVADMGKIDLLHA